MQLKDTQMLKQNHAPAHSCENRPKKLPCTPNERQIQKMKADMRSTAKVTNWPTRESHLYLKGCGARWLTHFHREKKTNNMFCHVSHRTALCKHIKVACRAISDVLTTADE